MGLERSHHGLAQDCWLRERVVPALDAIRSDPTRAISIVDLRARLAAEHAAAVNKRTPQPL